MSQLSVITSGAHGRNGRDGVTGRSGGGDGEPGQDGEHAKHARPVELNLRFEPGGQDGAGQAFIGDTSTGMMMYRPVPEALLGGSTLTIAARGGDGGHGG